MAVKVSLKSIRKHFESLADPRHTRNRKHRLVDIVVIAICGVLTGCDGPTSIARWARFHESWLRGFLELPHGIPSRDCLRRVLSLLKPEAFQACFREWIASCVLAEGPAEQHDGRTIAIDGKTLRRSHDRAAELGPLHLVSAWATQRGLALGQVAAEEKSNEIAAIPQLLAQIDIRQAIVTTDAMGCQKEIAAQILAGGGDYVLAVKDNQPKLCEAIRDFFSEQLENDLADVPHRRHESRDDGHGRVDERHYYLAKLPKGFPLAEQWPGLKAIGMAVRVSERPDGRTSDDVRYYIVSRYLSGESFAAAVREHWRIENSLHWVLDVNFREDESRTRKRRFADNLAWLRRFAVSLLKQHPAEDSLRGKMHCANWSTRFLAEVLTGNTS